MDAMVKSADENISAARSSWFPQVYLFGDYYYSKPNQRIQPLENKFYDTWDVGVALNWEIWNWGLTSSRVTQSEELKFQSEMALEQYRDKLREDVYAAYFSYKTALDKINVSKLSVEQADENYRITFEKYNQQLATSSDLIDAETSLSEAKINYTNTLVDYQIAKIQLDKLLGKNIY
jgi:outer membrane protein